ncbi:MAG: hypothetical protein MZU97_10340 [Bacillus subtilis]|nr:hypothetical protein [Bacillus subtilis]
MRAIDAVPRATIDRTKTSSSASTWICSRFDVEQLNFNRMTSFPTNTEIFHSWTDDETNEIGRLLFDACNYSGEYQDEADSSTSWRSISNHALGYKYRARRRHASNYYAGFGRSSSLQMPRTHSTSFTRSPTPSRSRCTNPSSPTAHFDNGFVGDQHASRRRNCCSLNVADRRRTIRRGCTLNLVETTPVNEGSLRTLNAYRYDDDEAILARSRRRQRHASRILPL